MLPWPAVVTLDLQSNILDPENSTTFTDVAIEHLVSEFVTS